MEKLLEDTQVAIDALPEDVDAFDAAVNAADFMSVFLHIIHPFSNGNGRTARVPYSWIMKSCATFPILLLGSSPKLVPDCIGLYSKKRSA